MVAISVEAQDWSQLIAYDSEGRQEYIGLCEPGRSAGTALPIWKLYKITYVASGAFDQASITWADGTNKAVNQWSIRDTYSYS